MTGEEIAKLIKPKTRRGEKKISCLRSQNFRLIDMCIKVEGNAYYMHNMLKEMDLKFICNISFWIEKLPRPAFFLLQ